MTAAPAKPLLVGELNPYGADPAFALYPEPRGASGDRLCRLIMGLSGGAYMAQFDRANLCTGKWSAPAARDRAEELLADPRWSTYVLLGAKVRGAFPTSCGVFESTNLYAVRRDVTIVALPHPSGRNLVWNEPGAVGRARAVLREAGVLPPSLDLAPGPTLASDDASGGYVQ